MKGKIFAPLAIAAAAVIAIGPAIADCGPDKAFSTAYGDNGNYDLVFQGNHVTDGKAFAADDTAVGGAVIGRVWQPGARATTGDTSSVPGCPDDWWLGAPANGGTMLIFGDNGADFGSGGQCGSLACPTNALIVLVQTKSTEVPAKNASYVVGRSIEQAAFPAFDFVRGETQNWPLVDIPRPIFSNGSRNATTATTDITLTPPAAAFHAPASDGFVATGTITGYQLVSVAGTVDPGREANLWSSVGMPLIPTTTPSVLGIQFPCPQGTTILVANRPIFDNGQFAADYVSAATPVACANLAEPGSPTGKKPKPIAKKTISQN